MEKRIDGGTQMDTINGRIFSKIKDKQTRETMVLCEERDLAYEMEVEDTERTYDDIVLNGKTIHGTKI